MDLTALSNTNQELLDTFAVISGLVFVFFGILLLGLGFIKILKASNNTVRVTTVFLIVALGVFTYHFNQ